MAWSIYFASWVTHQGWFGSMCYKIKIGFLCDIVPQIPPRGDNSHNADCMYLCDVTMPRPWWNLPYIPRGINSLSCWLPLGCLVDCITYLHIFLSTLRCLKYNINISISSISSILINIYLWLRRRLMWSTRYKYRHFRTLHSIKCYAIGIVSLWR